MSEILQSSIPYDPLSERTLPGVQPLIISDWLVVDDAYSAQMAERARLIDQHRPEVLALDDTAIPAAQELLQFVLDWLANCDGFQVAPASVTRPDGAEISIDFDDPLACLGHLVQEDFCLMDKRGDEHVLVGAVLCFPSSWMLSEKFMRPMIAIHDPVPSYDDAIAKRVQRLFDGVRVGRPLWRFNTLWHVEPTLFMPRSIHDRRPRQTNETAKYLRSEKQSILRLPKTGAVVFSIHTFMLSADKFRAVT